MKNHIVIPLSELIAEESGYDIDKIKAAFAKFKCEREKDLCSFLVRHAIDYDQGNIGKTFLFLNESKIKQEQPEFQVDAYVTLATKGLDISTLSKSKKKKVFGSYPGAESMNSISVFLIGQLGRADYCSPEEISGEDLLNVCYSYFKKASVIVGGKLVFLECREHMFNKFYEGQGFHKLKQDLNEDNLYELFTKIEFKD